MVTEKNTGTNDTSKRIQKDYHASILYASEIQKGLLPKERHFKKTGIDYAVWWEPHSILSGDFYWMGVKDNNIYICVGDCTGHGISASLLSVMGISLLNYIVLGKSFQNLGDYLKELDKKWIETFHSESESKMFNNDWMEMVLLRMDIENNLLEFSGAVLSPIIRKSNGEIISVPTNRFPIGGWQIEKNREFLSYKYKIEKGDEVYLFTDGIKDQFGGDKSKKFGSRKLKNIIQSVALDTMEEKVSFIKEIFYGYKNKNEQTDDVTLIGFKF